MMLLTENDIQKFIQVIGRCIGRVYLEVPNGTTVELNDPRSRYVGIGLLASEDGDLMELFAENRTDECHLIGFLRDLNAAHRTLDLKRMSPTDAA